MDDIKEFRWDWLRKTMGGREALMCQIFCGHEGGFSPCHYDPQDNIFGQIRGWKRVLLFHPRHACSLYPWPVHHPQDRQSRVDLGRWPPESAWPGAAELQGKGWEALLGPGDLLHIPPGWWHQVEMLPSPPDGEAVSFNFWYPAPSWFYGDLRRGELSWDAPLAGFRRVLFRRAVEELIAELLGPQQVPSLLRELATDAASGEAADTVRNFVATVIQDKAERRSFFEGIVSCRFAGLES